MEEVAITVHKHRIKASLAGQPVGMETCADQWMRSTGTIAIGARSGLAFKAPCFITPSHLIVYGGRINIHMV